MSDAKLSSAGPVDATLIENLVAASRILAHHGVLDAWGHVSMRHPCNPQRYLMSRARAPAMVSIDDIMEFDLDSNPIDQRDRRCFLERFIHGCAYKARPDVNAVVHSHSPTVVPFSVTDQPLRAISSVASFPACGCPVFDFHNVSRTKGLLITNNEQGETLAKVLGDIPRVIHRALYTEINAKQLATALSFGRPIKYIAEDEMLDPQRLGDSWDVWKTEAMGG
jgi:ribulose-5-phosphate 4-epimerase/fuculose-1-phosphate aldolase